MKRLIGLKSAIFALTAVALLASSPPASAKAILEITVNCNAGQTITDALRDADSSKPLIVNIRGTCIESLTITRNDVTLRGLSPTTSEIKGRSAAENAVYVNGAQRVALERLTVSGGFNGIAIRDATGVGISDSVIANASYDGINVLGGGARVSACTIKQAGQHGVNLFAGARAQIIDSTISLNSRAGLHIERQSGVSANGITVTSNGANGVELFEGSQVRIVTSTISANGTNTTLDRNGIYLSFSTGEITDSSINNNPHRGVSADGSTIAISSSLIQANGRGGIEVYVGSLLNIDGGQIANNGYDFASSSSYGPGVRYQLNSTGQISGAVITGNARHGIRLNHGSTLQFRGSTTVVTGNGEAQLRCLDVDSRVFGTSPDATTNCRLPAQL